MALTPPVLYSALASARGSGSFPFAGVAFDQLAWGIANGVATWGIAQPANLALLGASTGTAGAGVILPMTAHLVVPPNLSVVLAACLGAGMAGPLGSALATVVTSGISTAFSTAGQYTGTSAGVGVGADITKVVVSNAPSLVSILMGTLSAAFDGGGPALGIFAAGLGNGIAALLMGGTGVGSVTGPPSIYPGAGVTNSVVV